MHPPYSGRRGGPPPRSADGPPAETPQDVGVVVVLLAVSRTLSVLCTFTVGADVPFL
jgi:hypothetical protein